MPRTTIPSQAEIDREDETIVDADVIDDQPGTDIEVAQVPLVPLPEQLLLDQLGANWKWRKYRKPVEERIRQVEATLNTLIALNPQYGEPLGWEAPPREWPRCPSYDELWPGRPPRAQVVVPPVFFETGDVVRVTSDGQHVKVAHVDDLADTQRWPLLGELLGETSTE